MSTKSQNARILLGLKVKQQRSKKNLSFAELSEKSGLSVSYLNEIEKGKKYPKADKIEGLAKGLGVSSAYLISDTYDEGIAPVADLLKSNFLNELPLDLFGIELTKVVEIIANAPARVGAFISTLLEISRNYALREENFYFSALRSYLELHNNYFEELEKQVCTFKEQFKIEDKLPIDAAQLKQLLIDQFGYEIIEGGLDRYPELQEFRSIFLPRKKQLLLNGELNPIQQSFQYGKELAFQYLGLEERAYTSSLLRARTFEEVLNHSKAIYFSVALHLPMQSVIADIQAFFDQPRWNSDFLIQLLRKYDATPEMFYHRLTNILPQYFGLRKLFFLRITNTADREDYEIDRELHLNHRHQPHGNGLFEHYCRRWIAISSLQDLRRAQNSKDQANMLVKAQLSHYYNTQDKYLSITIARPAYPNPNKNVSVTIGLLITEELEQKVSFIKDPGIPIRIVHTTCERCALNDCNERSADPVIINRKKRIHTIQNKLDELMR